jgi:hypothetical protein
VALQREYNRNCNAEASPAKGNSNLTNPWKTQSPTPKITVKPTVKYVYVCYLRCTRRWLWRVPSAGTRVTAGLFDLEDEGKMFMFVGAEVLTAMVLKTVIWVIHASCSRLKVNRHVGGECRPHLHGRRLRQARNQHETASRSVHWFLASLNLWPCSWRRRFPPKFRLTFNGIRGVI